MNLVLNYLLIVLSPMLFWKDADVSSKNAIQNDIEIPWGSRKLVWEDFKGDVPSDSKFHALTHSAINLDFEGEGSTLVFNITTVFDPTKSWKKEGVDAYILNHEQGHFDITEYYARLLRKRLKSHRYSSFSSVSAEVKEMFNEVFDAANKMQVLYDKQTDHSRDKKKQKKWDKKIKKLLSSTTTYKNPKIKVNVSYLTN